MNLRPCLLAALACGLLLALCPQPLLFAQEPADQLAQAKKLYDSGEYQKALELLKNINEDDLAPEKQEGRRKLLKDAEPAANRQRQASDDLQEANKAFEAGQFEHARKLYQRAADNRFASEAVRQEATDQLDALDRKAALAPDEQMPPAEQQRLSQKLLAGAQEAMQAGRYADAEDLFDQLLEIMPGLPEAVAGKQKAQQFRATEGQAPSLLDRLRQQKSINWQRGVTTYRQAEEEVRQAIRQREFRLGQEKLQYARQVLEAARADAPSASAFDVLMGEANSLARFLAEEERLYQDELVRQQLRQQATLQARRVREAEEARRRQIDQLINTANQLRKERKYGEAVETLRQVLGIDPLDERARYMIEVLQDAASYQQQHRRSEEIAVRGQEALFATTEARMPWYEDVIFPRDWPEIRYRRERIGEAEEAEEDRLVRLRLGEPIPRIDFEDIPLEQVISYFREQMDVNIVVNWPVLETVGIDQSTEVSTQLKNVRFEKALETVLDYVGGGDTELGYVIDAGVLGVSTREDLSRAVFVRVYDINDLINRIPNFDDPPTPNLQAVQQAQTSGGGGGGGGGSNIFGGQMERTQQQDTEQDLEERIQDILELIRNTIQPESWRTNGGTVGAVEELNGQLIVTQTSESHDEVRALLRQLREARAVQVAIESRFIQVESNFFEQIGVDLDIILNNGNAGYDQAISLDEEGNIVALTDPATGGRVLIPRQFTRLGFMPAVPTTGLAFDTLGTPPRQPYQFAGLVPGQGQVAPHSSQWTPVPIGQRSIDIADLSITSLSPRGNDLITSARRNPAMQIFGSFLDNIQVDFLIRATQADQRTSTLNAPKLMLSNGQRANIVIGRQQAYVADFEPVVAEQVGLPDPIIGILTTGTTLDVQATVSADRKFVTLTLQPADSTGRLQDFQVTAGSLTAGTATIQQPIIDFRSLQTTVTVPDGATLLLGGQKISDEFDVEAGVPLLSKIPILKRAFSNRTTAKNEYTLLILVKPKIIILEEIEEQSYPL